MKTAGIILVALGILALGYSAVAYNKKEAVLRMGSLTVSATEHRSVAVPAVGGLVALVAGGAILMFSARSGRNR